MITFELNGPWRPTGKTDHRGQGILFDNGQCAVMRPGEGASIDTFPTLKAALKAAGKGTDVRWEYGHTATRKEQTRLLTSLVNVAVSPMRDYNIHREDADDEVLELRYPAGDLDAQVYHVCIRDGGWIEDRTTGDVDWRRGRTAAEVVDAVLALFPLP